MIPLEDYYKTNHATFANSGKFCEDAKESDVFPTEGIYIGEFESVTGNKLPALLSLEENRGLCFLTQPHNRGMLNKVIQTIVLRIASSLPAGLCKVIAYDGIGSGENLIALSELVNAKIMSKGIMTDSREFLTALREIQNKIPDIIQRTLGYKYAGKTLIDYNAQEKDNSQPFTFLVINDYPITLSKEHIESLETILKNCKRVGVFVIMTLDTTYIEESSDSRQQKKDIKPVMDYLTTIYEKGNRYYIRNTSHDEIFRHYRLSLDTGFLDNISEIVEYLRDRDNIRRKKVYKLLDYMPKPDLWWTEDSSSGIRVPFGLSEKSNIANLLITQQSGQNSAVVVGVPGSGKSVFLNTLICSSAIHYSPDELELYLIDFSGVEFGLYAKHKFPHARVIAPEPEREFGLSVLQKIEQEGIRRTTMCRTHDVGSIEEFRHCFPNERMPRILVIIDEFQKLFTGGNNALTKKAQEIILVLVKEYRKYGINLILATQKLGDIDRSILPRDLIANRIVFNHSPSDSGLVGLGNPVSLALGECIYNSKLGTPDANINVKTFYVPREEREQIATEMTNRVALSNMALKEPIVFRKEDLPSLDLSAKNIVPEDLPSVVRVYLGDSFAIDGNGCMESVFADISNNSNDNILIIGGEEDVAETIAVSTTESIVQAHNIDSALFCFLNFMENSNSRITLPEEMYGSRGLQAMFVHQSSVDLADCLKELNDEMEKRKADSGRKRKHVYITVLAAHRAMSLKRTGAPFNKPSEAGQILSALLKDGSQFGIHVVFQIDTLNNLSQIFADDALPYFNHRVALQMNEMGSKKVMGNELASQLFERGQEYSKFRGYYFHSKNLILTKFKPYKITNDKTK